MNEIIKLPFVLDNINIVSNSLKNKTQLGIVFKSNYHILKNINLGYFAKLIDNNTDLVDIYLFDNISNAIFARQTGITKKIVVLYYISSEEALLASEYDLEVSCPNIDWLINTIQLLGNKILKLHVYVDSGIGRYGFIEQDKLYDLMRKINTYSNLELVGLGTRFNPAVSVTEIYDNQLWKYEAVISQNRKDILKEYIQLQINTFNIIIKSSINQNLITKKTKIHAACSIEILNQLEDIYYDFVRIGGLIYDTIYQNFSVHVPILNIKKIPQNFCIGYFCLDGISKKSLNVAYIKYYGFDKKAIYKYNNIKLEVLISADPMGLIIPDGVNINVGDVIEIVIFKS
jgi:alanine racemase